MSKYLSKDESENILKEELSSSEVDLLNLILEHIEKEKQRGSFSASYFLPLKIEDDVSYDRICSCLNKMGYNIIYYVRADRNGDICERCISIR
jgi:hypothetical protein